MKRTRRGRDPVAMAFSLNFPDACSAQHRVAVTDQLTPSKTNQILTSAVGRRANDALEHGHREPCKRPWPNIRMWTIGERKTSISSRPNCSRQVRSHCPLGSTTTIPSPSVGLAVSKCETTVSGRPCSDNANFSITHCGLPFFVPTTTSEEAILASLSPE